VKRLGDFTADTLSAELGCRTCADVERVRSVIRDMRKSGEIVSVARGEYRYAATAPAGRTNEVFKRICRAMHLRGFFSARDLVILTDADESYVNVVIRGLAADAVVRLAGKRTAASNRRERVWELVHRDRFYLEYVR
jgi:transcription initiation factor IIE alpha subunit